MTVENVTQAELEADLPSSVVNGSRAASLSSHARAQAVEAALTVEIAEEATTAALAHPVTVNATISAEKQVNPAVPWVYQGADTILNGAWTFVQPLAPTNTEGKRLADSGGRPLLVYFDIECTSFLVQLSGAGSEIQWRLFADDECSAYQTKAAAGSAYWKIKFASRKRRRIVLELQKGCFFGGIVHEAADSLSAPSQVSTPSLAVLHDSFAVGGGANTANVSTQSYFWQLARYLGFTNTRMYGSGGTGFIKTNEVSKGANYFERVADIIGYKPSVLLIAGSTNDHEYAQATLETQIAKVIAAIREGTPGTQIVGASPMPVTTTRRAENEANAAACKAAFGAAALPYVDGFKLFPIIGNGTAGATTNEGPSDVYASGVNLGHPTVAGHDFIARQLAANIALALNIGQ